ncbi:13361_t:CDS:2 [Dentiscutata heterogama]|uniref:13361_t:CDS:1 n=1 Tax=Dentiscutata heterogama TaxID=1316150 RepID=A0ACA9L427_9GLOM|nr:13361_t:CDS:2 [Dentiscutata heterogama]
MNTKLFTIIITVLFILGVIEHGINAKHITKTCRKGLKLCDNTCADITCDDKNCGFCGNACIDGQICKKGKCICPHGLTRCDGTCVNTTSDNQNCRSCGNACLSNQACVNGRCICNISGHSECQTPSACLVPQLCGGPGCGCVQNVDGTISCIHSRVQSLIPCSSSRDCPSGQICVFGPCPAVNLCADPCASSQSSNILPASSENSSYLIQIQ